MIGLLDAVKTRLESLGLATNGVVFAQDLPTWYDRKFLGFNLCLIDYGDNKNQLQSTHLIKIDVIVPVGEANLIELTENTLNELQQAFFKKPLLKNTYTYSSRATIKVETKGIKVLKIGLEIKINVTEAY